MKGGDSKVSRGIAVDGFSAANFLGGGMDVEVLFLWFSTTFLYRVILRGGKQK